jgi:hypothetical protein
VVRREGSIGGVHGDVRELLTHGDGVAFFVTHGARRAQLDGDEFATHRVID